MSGIRDGHDLDVLTHLGQPAEDLPGVCESQLLQSIDEPNARNL